MKKKTIFSLLFLSLFFIFPIKVYGKNCPQKTVLHVVRRPYDDLRAQTAILTITGLDDYEGQQKRLQIGTGLCGKISIEPTTVINGRLEIKVNYQEILKLYCKNPQVLFFYEEDKSCVLGKIKTDDEKKCLTVNYTPAGPDQKITIFGVLNFTGQIYPERRIVAGKPLIGEIGRIPVGSIPANKIDKDGNFSITIEKGFDSVGSYPIEIYYTTELGNYIQKLCSFNLEVQYKKQPTLPPNITPTLISKPLSSFDPCWDIKKGKTVDACVDCLGGEKGFDPNRPNISQYAWTALGCIPLDPALFVSWLLAAAIKIGGGIAFLLMLWGGFQVMTSSGNPEQLNKGKNIITAAISGLLFIIFSMLLLKIIGVDILKLPGFQE